MTNAEAREAFIRACEKVEDADPVHLPMNTPVRVGGVRFRAIYDPISDAVGFVTEAEWHERLVKARAHQTAAEARQSYAAALHDAPPRRRRIEGWMGA